MKELKIVLIVIAIIVGSWGAITIVRMTIAYYALENLKQVTDQALKNASQRAAENNQRMRRETQERTQKDAEIKRQKEITLQKEAIEKKKTDREISKECQFWKLQSKNNPTEKTERKTKESCG